MPLVSIVIPTFRRPAVLRETLEALSKLDYPRERFEVIVIDDGSDDETPEVVNVAQTKLPNLSYNYQTNSGVAKARNQGARLAKGDILVFNDDDILVEPDNIQKHIRHLSEFGKCLVCGHWEFAPELTEYLESTSFGRYRIAMENWYKSENGKKFLRDNCYECETVSGQNFSIRKKDFWSIGGFDEEFPFAGYEDHEFTRRAIKAGYKFIYDYDLNFFNNDHRIDITQFGERLRRGAITKVLMATKYPNEEAAHPMIVENCWRKPDDSLKRSAKKTIKSIAASSVVSNIIFTATRVLERTWKNNSMLPRLYNAICGIYIFRGIREGIERYGEPDKNLEL